MLNATEYDVHYAVHRKKHFRLEDIVPKALYIAQKAVVVEKWSYDPALLSVNNMVDDISLILSLKDNKDERVQMEVDRLRSKYQW